MEMFGSIRPLKRRIQIAITRSAASSTSFSRFTFPQETAQTGLGEHLSGPGSFFAVLPRTFFYRVPKSLPVKRTLTSYIPLQRKSCLGAISHNDEEQLP